MKRKLLILISILAMALWVAPALASTFTLNESGIIGGLAVSGTMKFTTGNGYVDIEVYNTTVDPRSSAQLISGLDFILSNGATSATLGSSSGFERWITAPPPQSADGSFTTGATRVSTNWGVDPYPVGIKLDALGFNAPPKHLIIGLPNSGTGKYSNANQSIENDNASLFGSAAEPVKFHVLVNGVTASTTVFGGELYWGTNGATVPIPPAALLMGSGLLGLVALGWRRKKS